MTMAAIDLVIGPANSCGPPLCRVSRRLSIARPPALPLAHRARSRWRGRQARQGHALIDREADCGNRHKQDGGGDRPGDSVLVVPIVRTWVVPGCTRVHPDLLG